MTKPAGQESLGPCGDQEPIEEPAAEVIELHSGLYDQLVTLALQRRLENPELESRSVPLSPDTASEALARHIFRFAAAVLGSVTGKEPEKLAKQIELTNGLLDWLAGFHGAVDPDGQVTARRLMQVLRRDQVRLGTGELPRPSIPLRHSDLIVNGPKDLRMGREIQKEIASADRVDVLVSFVK